MASRAEQVEHALQAVLEDLAAIEHERWASWQQYLHEQGIRQADGSILLKAELVSRWELQIQTPYCSLSEEEKDSDRDQVRRYLPIVRNLLEQESSRCQR